MNLNSFHGCKVKNAQFFENYVWIEFDDCSFIKVFVGEDKELCVATTFCEPASKRHEDDDDIEWVEYSKYGVRASPSQIFHPVLPTKQFD